MEFGAAGNVTDAKAKLAERKLTDQIRNEKENIFLRHDSLSEPALLSRQSLGETENLCRTPTGQVWFDPELQTFHTSGGRFQNKSRKRSAPGWTGLGEAGERSLTAAPAGGLHPQPEHRLQNIFLYI